MSDRPQPRYGSDLMVDLLIEQEIPYVALNPGASFRGLHDSLVNRPGAPEMITCPHEKLAVNMAHGYAKATGKPMVAILHDTVGLLHGTLGIFTAFLDRAPVIVLGGAGPMNTARRRPQIDWVHTSNIQGNAVRDFTKWDDQPVALAAMPEAFARARRVALTQPTGPVYVALDADLQEREIGDEVIPHFDQSRVGPGSPIGADEATLRRVVETLVAAQRPVIIAGFAGRDPAAFTQIPELAELLGAGMIETNHRLNMPNRHRLNVTGTDALGDADVVLLLDVKDRSKPLNDVEQISRRILPKNAPDARIIDIGFNDLQVTAWIQDYGQLQETDIQLTADTSAVLPQLIERVRAAVADEGEQRAEEREQRRRQLAELHDQRWSSWAEQAAKAADERPVAPSQLAAAVWPAIRDHDWVLTAGTGSDWAPKLWDFDRPYRHPGKSLGTATQVGISMGVALANKGSGRLVVDLQPDGDLMFDAGSLWIASAHRIPMLVVMFNNRAYYNDWEHQIRLAKARGTDLAKAHIGVNINGPAPDFANLARSFGWHAEGPIEDPSEVTEAVARGAQIALEQERPVLVDVVCQFR
ncbi:MAG TPA: thiamine pyrophosphate-binding protein [Candidatus Limnocylindria bacterium]|nr:thiamine pyrophosphate-binding protein [Candidatus Limnocylindria bacterium]